MNALSMSTRQPYERRATTPLPNILGLGGALAGLAGGAAMMLVAALLVGARGADIWLQAKAVASLVLGSAALAPAGFALVPVLVGTIIHLAVSALLGALFEIGSRRIARLPSDFGVPAVTGLAYGLLIWLAAYFVVAPALSPLFLAIYAPALIIQHVVFGTIAGMTYAGLRLQPYASMR